MSSAHLANSEPAPAAASRDAALTQNAPNVLAALRTETQTVHLRLHDHPLLAPLTEGVIGEEAYRRILVAFYGFYAGWRRGRTWRLAQALDDPLGALAATIDDRLARLRSDLSALGVSGSDVDDLPVFLDLPPPNNAADAAGCLYVVEGSSLGGAMIARRLHAHASFTTSNATRYFGGRGAATGDHWKQTRALIAATCEAADTVQAAVNAANATFAGLEDWLWHCWHNNQTITKKHEGDRLATRCS